jgi:hypothetical protein
LPGSAAHRRQVSASVEGPFADDRTSIFPPSCCRGCGGRGVGVAAAGRAEAWACSGRGAAICVRVFSSLGRRIHGSVEDTKLSTNKQHTLSVMCTMRCCPLPSAVSHEDGAPGAGAEDCITSARRFWRVELGSRPRRRPTRRRVFPERERERERERDLYWRNSGESPLASVAAGGLAMLLLPSSFPCVRA